MSAIEKYSRAVGASNLRDDDQHHQTEILAAAALSSVFGAKLWRVKYCNDATSYPALLAEWETTVGIKCAVRNWPQHVKYAAIAKLSLNHWLNDVCTECGGKGHLPLEAIPNVLSDAPCSACGGSGVAKVACEKRDLRYVEDMIADLHELTRNAAVQTQRKLGGRKT